MSQPRQPEDKEVHMDATPAPRKGSSNGAPANARPEGARNDADMERIFLSDDVIPDAADSFQATIPAVDDAIESADIVLDTNVLLLPYGAGSSSLAEITKALKALAEQNRLFLPGQVAREFIRNRPNKVGDLLQQLKDKVSRYIALEKINFPILEGDTDYENLNEVIRRTANLKKELNEANQAVVRKIRAWEWNDPVNTAYKTLFRPETIISPKFDRSQVIDELRRRQKHQIPPGYKDASKDDAGIGDFLIWLAILEIGRSNKKPLIFVSGEEKADWQHRSGGDGFIPRYELIDEYRRASDGKAFYILPLSRLLELLEVEKASVEQIKHEEVRVQEANSTTAACPKCQTETVCHLGEYIGSSAHARCPACLTQFHIHRTREGVIVREHGPTRSSEQIVLTEEVHCPNCDVLVSTVLSSQFNATRWCRCEACDMNFPIHRRADGGVTVSRAGA